MGELFRDEAVEHHAGRRGPGDVLRVGSPWLARLYWLLLVAVALGVVASLVVRVDGERLLRVLVGG